MTLKLLTSILSNLMTLKQLSSNLLLNNALILQKIKKIKQKFMNYFDSSEPPLITFINLENIVMQLTALITR